ncbi:transcription factor mef2A-like [Drosophila virilis]|uniref:transcription factor mef2A-like n=1 Tax=Drosophila virilis TaxID=7244 RepID=UPI0038B28FFA
MGGYQAQLAPHQLQQHNTHALQMQQQQQPQSLPTDLTATTTATATSKTQSSALAPTVKHQQLHQHPHKKARSNKQQQQQQHLHPHPHSHLHPHPGQGHVHHRHQHRHCHRQHQPLASYYPTGQYYDDLEEVAVRQGARRPSMRRTLLPAENACNCVSCYALAPLCGQVPAPRPQRSLSQQQLRRHQRLSGGLLDRHVGVSKWCSESDISVLEQVQEDEPNTMTTDERYEDSNDYDDFDLDFDDMDETTASGYPQRQLRHGQQPRAVHSNEETDMYVDRAQLRQLAAPALLAARQKSQSTESFFEQPNEEGSLYMYGGRRRIVAKAPSVVNIYERVPNSMDSDIGYGKFQASGRRAQYYNKPKLPAPSWRGKRQPTLATHLQKADKKPYENTSSNSNNKRQLTNSSNNNDDILKNNKKNFNSKNKSITAGTAATKSLTTATAATVTATATSKQPPPTAAAAATATATATAQTTTKAVATATNTNNAQPAQRTGRTASRLDISDMESIYGYLKPRKPRSLSLKKIQILDY